ncbi:MAG: hypothetical protein K2Y23_13580 [Cyanobacteria bacterium]|nr:hypothetical protein [Cyanobacteriota bacterium]
MLTLVQIRDSAATPEETASLMADYLAFDRRRGERRQYAKAFGGIAIIVLLGAACGRVPIDEAWKVAGLLAVPPSVMAVLELFHWNRLMRRLNGVRAQVQLVRKS